MNLVINHVLFSLDANIEDLKSLIDNKRPAQKVYKLAVCDLWIRLETIEQMKTVSLVTALRKSQLSHLEMNPRGIQNNDVEDEPQFALNPRRSRFLHFHITKASDQFDFNLGSYVGLVIFSYQNQSKFILKGHHSRRGDIIVKPIKFFSSASTTNRNLYDTLFKWYFGQSIDEKFVGIGFVCCNGRWRFDLITHNDNEILPYEYRIFDMFMLTHWLTQFTIPHNARDMEILSEDLLFRKFEIVKQRVIYCDRTELLNVWSEVVGSDANDLELAITHFLQMIKNEIDFVFKDSDTASNVTST